MAFENLSERLQNAIKMFRGSGKITEDDLKAPLREVRMALLEADVNFKVVKDFVANIKERALGETVQQSLTPGQQIIKIVNDELTQLLGGTQSKLTVADKPPTVIMLVGLQGAGKTTTAGKLGSLLRKKGKKPLLVAGDVYRPAAIKQLQVLGEQLSLPVFALGDQVSPVEIARKAMDKATEKYNLNFSLIATPAEGLSGRFVKMDKKLFGELDGITDREYYTNSFHIPVYYPISAFKKIKLEGPYHELTNGGHISYVEMDGDPTKNIAAFEKIVRAMHDNGIGYGAINHPVDRDPVCGYNGIIDDVCPLCGRSEEEHHGFERIRRITGYLVGTLDRFNDGKKAEESDRVKHETKE